MTNCRPAPARGAALGHRNAQKRYLRSYRQTRASPSALETETLLAGGVFIGKSTHGTEDRRHSVHVGDNPGVIPALKRKRLWEMLRFALLHTFVTFCVANDHVPRFD